MHPKQSYFFQHGLDHIRIQMIGSQILFFQGVDRGIQKSLSKASWRALPTQLSIIFQIKTGQQSKHHKILKILSNELKVALHDHLTIRKGMTQRKTFQGSERQIVLYKSLQLSEIYNQKMSVANGFPFQLIWPEISDIPHDAFFQDSMALKYLYFCHLQQADFQIADKAQQSKEASTSKMQKTEARDSLVPVRQVEIASFSVDQSHHAQQCSKKERRAVSPPQPAQKKKKGNKKPVQTPQRNILPNILHQACCFIQMRKRSENLTRKYFVKNPGHHSTETMVSRFYTYQKVLKAKMNPYLNLKALRKLGAIQDPMGLNFQIEEQRQFVKLTRILVKYFLDHQLDSSIMTSVRMKSDSRPWHFQWKRKVSAALQEVFSECDNL